jgi:hypothetical protein
MLRDFDPEFSNMSSRKVWRDDKENIQPNANKSSVKPCTLRRKKSVKIQKIVDKLFSYLPDDVIFLMLSFLRPIDI